MAVLTRIYASKDEARAAHAALLENDFGERSTMLLVPAASARAAPAAPPSTSGIDTSSAEAGAAYSSAESEAAAAPPAPATGATRDAIKAGTLLGAQAEYYLDQVEQGFCVVAVDPPFGRSARASELLDQHNPVESAAEAEAAPAAPARPYQPVSARATPLSSALGFKVLARGPDPLSRSCGFPTLTRGRSFMSRWFAELSDNKFTVSAIFSMPIKSGKPAPLSGLLGLPVKSGRSGDGWTRSMGLRMLSKRPAPLSAFFGIPLLKGHYRHEDYAPARDDASIRRRSAPLSDFLWMGPLAKRRHTNLIQMFPALTRPDYALSSLVRLPLLSRQAAPLSKVLSLRTKTADSAKEWKSSFGFPLISRNPAPLSRFLRMPVLSRNRLLY